MVIVFGIVYLWKRPPPGSRNFIVKIGLRDVAGSSKYELVIPGSGGPDDRIEWFWTRSLREDGAGYAAEIDNDPETIRNVKNGETVRFTRAYVGDWMYLRNGKIVGNATACPALAHADSATRRQMADQYGLVCD